MTSVVRVPLSSLPFNQKEALRYAGAVLTDELSDLIISCRCELEGIATPMICGTIVPVSITDDEIKLSAFTLNSRNLAKNLRGCSSALIFAATLGIGVDRTIFAASRTSPSKAVLLQGAAAEGIEALCDAAEERFIGVSPSRPRFSPGYGDLSLEAQRVIFSLLSPEKHIGLTLNESLMLSPSKSVTAIVGICDEGVNNA